MFGALSDHGISGRAIRRGLVELSFHNPRDFARDAHRTVDDRPYGGGPGMVMQYQPLAEAISRARENLGPGSPVLLMSPQGRPLDQEAVAMLAQRERMILVAGRYEGIDERVVDALVDEEWSIGDYVTSGGELPAMVLLDAVIRLIPGVLGHEQSAEQDSFSGEGLLDCPHYTRPEEIAGRRVPEVLLSGDHAAIARWRRKQALGRTWLRRPDRLERLDLSEEDRRLLQEFIEDRT
ncbi:MAG: tRNA (guanosine(37)-N1)-methyltransferase TrmD [Gammaproteobacteria bacterium]|nr:MAG: tRNA (guanosine(37)-N1)-methyltransferase TrmD [Gammaproteobacteria bacterium]